MSKALQAFPFEDFGKFCKLESAVSTNSEVVQSYFSSSRLFSQAVKDWLPKHTAEVCPMQIKLKISVEDVMSVDAPAFKPPSVNGLRNGNEKSEPDGN